jgi:UDP-N-acetylglucosamine:LPS N-acetylglucosamine transferase
MRILIVSVNAGGGHTTAMHSLRLALQHWAPEVQVETFVSSQRLLEQMHRLAYRRCACVYHALYKATAHSAALRKAYFRAVSPSIQSFAHELTPLLDQYDAVISTHFMQTYALLHAKHSLGLPTSIMAYVPDFDHSCLHVPSYAGQRVDAVIAQGALLLTHLAHRDHFTPMQLQRAGFVPRPAFTAVQALSAVQARERVAALDLPLVSRLRPDALTIVVTGGTYWTMGLYGLLKRLASYAPDGARPVFTQPSQQILVVCGHNTKAYRAYRRLRQTTGLNVIPLPFLAAEPLAAVFRSADATVLASVAPATLYELLEARSGPLLVHRVNPGPERDNLAFFTKHHLAQYLPRPQELLAVLGRLSAAPSWRAHWQETFWQLAERECLAARERAHQNAAFIVRVAAQRAPSASAWLAADGLGMTRHSHWRYAPEQRTIRHLLARLSGQGGDYDA